MHHEVSHRHLAAGQKSRKWSQQPNEDEHAADQLNACSGPVQHAVRSVTAKHSEHFAGSVAGKQESKHDSQRRVCSGLKFLQSVHSIPFMY